MPSQAPSGNNPRISLAEVPDPNSISLPKSLGMRSNPQMDHFALAETLNRLDSTPVEPVLLACNGLMDRYALHFAAEEGLINEVRWVLAHGRDVNEENDDSETPLKLAVQSEHM